MFSNFVFFLLLLCLSCSLDSSDATDDGSTMKKKKILSLGGNGMIGAEVLSRLIETKDYDITLVSRGSWPFDTEETIKPNVRYVYCDRSDGGSWKTNCPDLWKDVEDTDEYYAILDFSGYEPDWVNEAVKALDGKARVYVYVSTDNVYEVSEIFQDPPVGGRLLLETDAVRPKDEELRDELNEFDDYGDEKLECEELLVEQRKGGDGGIPFVALRFADVLGPRDHSDRFETYFVWIKFLHVKGIPPIHVPSDVLESSSITYVEDAAISVILAMDKPSSWDEAYNIACEEVFNVTSALTTLGRMLGKPNVQPERWDPDDSFSNYPSVTRGALDVSKAKDKLGFVPTSVEDVLKKTVSWYENLFQTDEEKRDDMIEEMMTDVFEDDDMYSSDDRESVSEAINRELDMMSDEL